jgi:hypothetical protein
LPNKNGNIQNLRVFIVYWLLWANSLSHKELALFTIQILS